MTGLTMRLFGKGDGAISPRPKLPKADLKKKLSIALTPASLAIISAQAKSQRRSMSAMIDVIVEEWLQMREYVTVKKQIQYEVSEHKGTNKSTKKT